METLKPLQSLNSLSSFHISRCGMPIQNLKQAWSVPYQEMGNKGAWGMNKTV